MRTGSVPQQSLTELVVRIDRLHDAVTDDVDEVRDELRRLADRLVDGQYQYVRQEVHDDHVRELREEIARVAASAQWTFGLVASSIIGAVVLFVITAVRGG
jgi:hypothetical protein